MVTFVTLGRTNAIDIQWDCGGGVGVVRETGQAPSSSAVKRLQLVMAMDCSLSGLPGLAKTPQYHSWRWKE